MILQMFAVFDSATKAYHAPFFQNSRGQAVRTFSDLANDSQTMLCKHPSDYTLFHTGNYDDTKGIVTSEKHSNLGKAIEFISQPESPPHAAPISNGPQLLGSPER